MLLEKTLEVSVSKFEELCKTDARMETLKAYISNEENGYIKLDTVKAIIGLPVKHEEPSVWEHEELSFDSTVLRHTLAYIFQQTLRFSLWLTVQSRSQ